MRARIATERSATTTLSAATHRQRGSCARQPPPSRPGRALRAVRGPRRQHRPGDVIERGHAALMAGVTPVDQGDEGTRVGEDQPRCNRFERSSALNAAPARLDRSPPMSTDPTSEPSSARKLPPSTSSQARSTASRMNAEAGTPRRAAASASRRSSAGSRRKLFGTPRSYHVGEIVGHGGWPQVPRRGSSHHPEAKRLDVVIFETAQLHWAQARAPKRTEARHRR